MLHRPAGGPRTEHAESESGQKQFCPQAEELAAPLLLSGAQSHAHADFAAALADGVSQHAVGADRGKQQRDNGEDAGEHRGRTARDDALVDQGSHGLQIVDGQLGIDREDGPAEYRSHRLGRHTCPH
jgi:hypothetical protein